MSAFPFRLILIYLIPVKMLLVRPCNYLSFSEWRAGLQGHMPSVRLLSEYDLLQFVGVAKAVRYSPSLHPPSVTSPLPPPSQGNMRLLTETLQKNEVFYSTTHSADYVTN